MFPHAARRPFILFIGIGGQSCLGVVGSLYQSGTLLELNLQQSTSS